MTNNRYWAAVGWQFIMEVLVVFAICRAAYGWVKGWKWRCGHAK